MGGGRPIIYKLVRDKRGQLQMGEGGGVALGRSMGKAVAAAAAI